MARVGTGIDLGSDSIKIIQGRFKGETFQILRARRFRLPPGEDRLARIGEVLKSTPLKGSGLLGLTGKDIIIRYTQVPPVTPQRLKTLMEFEVGEIIAQSGGDVVADYEFLPLEEGPEEEDLVLLGLVKDNFLSERMHALKTVGIRVDGACPNALALFNCFLKNGDYRSEEVTLLLNIGADNCDIALQKNAQLIFARNQSLGGNTFTQALMEGLGVDLARAEKLKQLKADLTALLPGQHADQDAERLARTLVGPAGRLFSTIQSTLTFAKNQSKIYNLKLGRVFLTGGGSRLRGLDAYLARNLGIPVEHFDPLAAADASALPPEEAREIHGRGIEMAVALGLAQMAVDPSFFRITLLPEKVRKLLEFKKSTSFMVAAGVLLLLFFLLSFLEARSENTRAASRASKVRVEKTRRLKAFRKHGDLKKHNAELRRKVDLLARRKNLGPALVKAWQAVQKHLPPEFWIKDLRVKSDAYRPIEAKKKELTRRGAAAGRRSGKEVVLTGPELPTVILVGGARESGRQLVPVLNRFEEALREEKGIHEIQRKDRIGAGKLEFTLHLIMVDPPGKTGKNENEEEPS